MDLNIVNFPKKFDSAGVKLIAIGVVTPDKAATMADRKSSSAAIFPKTGDAYISLLCHLSSMDSYSINWELPFPMDCLYADPERKAWDVLGLYDGFGRTFFNPASVFSRSHALRKAVKNNTIEAIPDDGSGVLQQGGVLVFKGKQLFFQLHEGSLHSKYQSFTG